MIATSVVARSSTPLARLMPLVARLPGLVPNQCLVLGLGDAPDERIAAAYGPVQIRQTQGGLSAQTRVKGEQDQALATALQRMRQFLCRNQRNGFDVRLQRSLVQSEEAPGRWVGRMGLIGPEAGIVSRASRGGRVKILFAAPETAATLRVPGRATIGAVRRATGKILDALEPTPWMASGEPAIRFETPLPDLPLLRHFEVAIRVSRRD